MAISASCPNTDTLQRYAMNELSPDQMLTITKHLVRCRFCNDDVQMLKRAGATLAAPTPVDPFSSGTTARMSPKPTGSSTEIRSNPAPAGKSRDPYATASPTESRYGPSPPTTAITRKLPHHQSLLCSFLSPPQRDDEIGRLGPYRVLKILGHGGMGVVFEAEDEGLQRKAAIKTLHANHAADPTARQRFLQEGRSAAAVDHENVVTIYGVSEENGVPYLAMQFLQGRSLDQKLRTEKPLPTREILRIGQEISYGLAAAHKLRLVHRDIKPSNIWLTAELDSRSGAPIDGRVKILDFGLARAMEQKGPGLTQQGLVVGTAGYMSPEQARGQPIDTRADLYSLGCVLYEMGTGRLPLEGPDSLATLVATMLDTAREPLVFNPGLPTPLSDLIMKLLAKHPDERPASAASVAQNLGRLAQGPSQSLDQLRARLLGGKK